MLDFDLENFQIDILFNILNMNKCAFPDFLKDVYCINVELDDLGKEAEQRLREVPLRKYGFKGKVFLFDHDYYNSIFGLIDRRTVSVEFFGDLDDCMIELEPILIQTLKKRFQLNN